MDDIELRLPSGTIRLRRARAADAPAIVGLLADDPISNARGDSDSAVDPRRYDAAFQAIDADRAHLLLVGVSNAGQPIATMQLTIIPGLGRGASPRLQIEAVRVGSDHRGRGIGRAMMLWALEYASEVGAGLVQLTSDAKRNDAHRFYEGLGFTASHVGFKYVLPAADGSHPPER
ncbi:MAG: hypothetical protein RI885_424 [Actinomycetota bacterium]|jgi:GNAT superfamily N-acetyltransferase